jgi:hypothetical protein
VILSGCDNAKLTSSYFDTTGSEIVGSNKSGNISVSGCKNASGKKLGVQK